MTFPILPDDSKYTAPPSAEKVVHDKKEGWFYKTWIHQLKVRLRTDYTFWDLDKGGWSRLGLVLAVVCGVFHIKPVIHSIPIYG